MHHELLVIDDAALHLAVLCKIAEQVGFRVTGARSVAQASQLLHDRAFDCITLDLSLGEGIEVLQELSKIKCPTPIFVISATGEQACDETVRIGNVLNLNICSPVPRPIHLSAVRTALTKIAADTGKPRFARAAG